MDSPQDGVGLDLPSRSAPQAMATLIMGPTSCGYSAQMLLFGAFVSMFLEGWRSGALQAQSRPARLALWTSLVLNTVNTGMCVYQSFDSAVSQNRSFFYLSSGNIAWNALSVLNGVIAALSEGFLAVKAGSLIARRPWRLLFWAWQACVIALVLAASAIVTADGCLYNLAGVDGTVPTLALDYNTASAVWLWSSAVADVSNSLAFARALSSRIHGFNETTDNLLRRLILIAIRTASYTTALSIAGAVANSIWGDDDTLGFVAIGLWLPMPALYGLALLSFSFSSRRAIDSRLGGSSDEPSAPPRGNGIYVRRSVRAFDSKGLSVRRLGLSNEHELVTLPTQSVPAVRITVEQHRVTESDDVDLELGKASTATDTPGDDEWRRNWRGEKSWQIQP